MTSPFVPADAQQVLDHHESAGHQGQRQQQLVEQSNAEAKRRFDVEAEIGAGGMGRVFRAVDRETGERVALKVVRRDALGDARAHGRFLRGHAGFCAGSG